ncbi:unnamed protein product, partial [Hapterophycus canaliculatus]
ATEQTDHQGREEEVISSLNAVEGKEDEQPRWPTPQAAAGPPPSSALGEGAQKVDGDEDGAVGDGDGWGGEEGAGESEQTDEEESGTGSESDPDDFDGAEHSNDISVAETTASDFFATPTSPESDLGSPRPRARREGRASMSSLSPLSGYNSSGSRRKRRETSDGSGGIFSSSSPYTLADVPPIFPPSAAPRARRMSSAASAAAAAAVGGLPPPVPVTHTHGTPAGTPATAERLVRSAWRSLSPSRAGDDRGWSLSPVLAARAGSHRSISPVLLGKANLDGVGVAYVSPSARMGKGRTTGSAGVARLGLAMGMPSGAPLEPAEALGPRPKPCGVVDGSGTSAPPPPLPPASEGVPKVPCEEDAEQLPPDVAVSNEPDGGPVGSEIPAGEEEQPSRSPVEDSADAEAPGARRPPPASSDSDQGWVTGLSEAAPPEEDRQGRPPVGDQPDTSVADDVDRSDDSDPQDTPAGLVSDGKIPPSSPQSPAVLSSDASEQNPPAAAAPSAVGVEPLVFGVTAGPSPFVNTSSPLTRSRNKSGREDSLFGTADGANGGADSDYGDIGTGGVSGGVSGGAADLFAAEAPARAADELFSAGPPLADTATAADGSGGVASDTSLFSKGPPPETLTSAPPSLPNPWGSSPLKQPLAEPKRWPTTGGTGFDRPLTPSAAAPGASGMDSSRAGEAGAIPSAFFGPTSDELGAEDGGFGGGAGGG